MDNTLLKALSRLSMQQAKPTENTLCAAIKLLNYAATHPDACVQYRASDMVLHIHSDASYLSETEACSAVAAKRTDPWTGAW